jgi:hypothetical protein
MADIGMEDLQDAWKQSDSLGEYLERYAERIPELDRRILEAETTADRAAALIARYITTEETDK